MSTLQEVLTVLLGAESEAKRAVEESKKECSGYLRSVQEKFAGQRESEIEAAREQAKSIIGNATNAAKTETEQIIAVGKDERERIQRHYDNNIDALIGSMAAEAAENLIAKRHTRA